MGKQRKFKYKYDIGDFKYKYDIGDTVIELGSELWCKKPFIICMKDQYLMGNDKWKPFYRGGNKKYFRRLRSEDNLRICRMVIVEKTIDYFI